MLMEAVSSGQESRHSVTIMQKLHAFKQGDLDGCHMLPPDHHIHGYHVTMTTTATTATDEVPK